MIDTKLLKQKILDLAIRGKLVPQDSNDEPASVLLERIRAEKEKLVAEGKIKRSKSTTDNRHYENPLFEIPNSWKWVYGFEIFNPMQSTKPEGESFDYIDIDAIDNKRNLIIAPKHLASADAPSRATRQVSKGDVLFSMVRPYLRNIAKVEKDKYIASTGFYVCKPNKAITSDYCFFLMISNYVVDGLNHFMKGDNSPSINNDNILSWQYPLPPINEQYRITATIEKWFNIIDEIGNYKQDLQKAVTQAKRKILSLAISGKLVTQDPTDEPAIELLKRINPKFIPCDTSHYTNLPRNWCVSYLKDIAIVINGKNQSKVIHPKGQYPIYGSGGIMGYADDYLCPEHCTIIGRKGTINNPILVETKFWNVDTAFGMKPNEEIDYRYFYYFCKSFDFSKLDKSTTLPSLTKSNIEQIEVPIPPLAEQNRIVNKIEEVLVWLDMIISEL